MRRILLPFLALISLHVIAQEDEVLSDYSMDILWGPVIEIDDSKMNSLIGATEDHYFLQSFIDGGWFSIGDPMFSKLSIETNELQWSVLLEDLEYKGEEIELIRAFVEGEGMALIFEVYHDDDEQHYLLRMDISSDGEVSELIVLSALRSDDDDEGSLTFHGYTDEFKSDGTLEDPNNGYYNRYLIRSEPQFEEEEHDRMVYFDILDSTYFNVLHTEIELPYSYESTQIKSASLGSGDSIYLLLSKDVDEERGEEEEDDMPNRSYFLYVIDPHSGEMKEVDLGLSSIYVSEINMSFSYDRGAILINGIYSNKRRYGRFAGDFFISVESNTGNILSSTIHPFDAETLAYFMDEDDIEDGDEVRKSFEFREAILREDGGLIAIYEHYEYYVTAITNPNTHTTTYQDHYIYGDLILVNYSPEAEAEWTVVIKKLFHYPMPDLGGYMSISIQDRVHIIYNDDEDNPEYWSGEEDDVDNVDLKDGNIAMVTVDLEGNMIYEVIDQIRDDDKLYFQPRASTVINGTNGERSLWFRQDDDEIRIGQFKFIEKQ